MKTCKYKTVLISLLLINTPFFVLNAQNDTNNIEKFIKQTSVSGKWFLAYNYNLSENTNQFQIKRGYLTVKSQLSNNISVRYTQDITTDEEGSDAGNIEIRMKYLYMKFAIPDFTIFKNMHIETGLVHTPWLSFEGNINNYRVLGKMFADRSKLLISADFGITLGGNIGEELSVNIKNKVGKYNAGKYGSFSIGIFNGGGYHDIEYNNNKTFEGRLSIRPFPNYFPSLQLSYATSIGKSNIEINQSNYNINLFALSIHNKKFTLATQYTTGNGNFQGNYFNTANQALYNSGISIIGDIKIPKTNITLFSRYDNFQIKRNTVDLKEFYIVGIKYNFLQNNILFFYQTDFYGEFRSSLFELALEVKF
ncbi:MAG: hypothetical protein U9Q83_02220 [Bacteroidota bacterium]|nr:hypothetical protein [Bacteroidota bacterium]